MGMGFLYGLCILACVLIAVVGLFGGGSESKNEALRARLERRRATKGENAGISGGQSAQASAPRDQQTSDEQQRVAA